MESIRDAGSLALNLYYLTLIILMIYHRKYLGSYVEIIILALSVTFLTEITTTMLQYYGGVQNTVAYYVIGIVGIVYLLLMLYFYRLMQDRLLRRIQGFLIILHVTNFVASAMLIKDFFLLFPEVTNFISIFVILVSLFIFLYDTFNSDKILHIRGFFPFFVAVSLTFIYVGLVPILFFSSRIVLQTEKLIFYIMLFTINVLGYSIMLAGIFFAKIQKKGII
ncbi:MAG: hypothetical protein K0M63_04240 [Weeksellaceae bacterium]|nr:hypothetical protein [Weeksellaceae bacterium]